MTRKYNNILDQIGHTPLIPIRVLNPNPKVEILAKLEHFNPAGSVKDRVALYMIEAAETSGELTRDKIILEATSGNTGIGLALVAAVKGYRIQLVMSEAVSQERIKILRAMGAEIAFTPGHLGTDGAIEYTYNLSREAPDTYWLADQFNNEANWRAHYETTAMEIWNQTQGRLDAVVAAMGTTGTLMGLSRRLKELDPHIEIIGVEPYLGHKIQGLKNMKESYRPGIFEKSRADRIINIDDDEAYETARLLARKEGLFVGMSSGAAMAVALREAARMEQGRMVVMLPDGGERYLSTSLFVGKERSGLRFFNTLSRKKEEFVPLQEKQVSMYTCGPTLCQGIDLNQCRRILFADLVRRVLESKGYAVTHIMNLTDLDDRTIEGAEKAGLSLREFTDGYHAQFMEDLDHLGVLRASRYPRASDYVDHMIDLTQRLLDRGYAYEKLRSIYFDISRFKDYGRLSRIDLEKIQVGKTVDLDQYEKDNPRDFTLLKRATLLELKKGLFTKTKWGNVRPGWHLECPAMAMQLLGPTYDIHTSGVELIFPHHENTIAISQAITGRPPAQYWIHSETVHSKQTGVEREDDSPLGLRELLKEGFTGREVRYWLLSRHYRKPVVFSRDNLQAARHTLRHLDQFVHKVYGCTSGPDDPGIDQAAYELRRGSTEAMADDFNMAPALASLFQFTGKINRTMDRQGLSLSDRQRVLQALERINGILGFLRLAPLEADAAIEDKVKKREQARKAKDWALADGMREELQQQGVEVIDTKNGPVWRRVSFQYP